MAYIQILYLSARFGKSPIIFSVKSSSNLFEPNVVNICSMSFAFNVPFGHEMISRKNQMPL